ncbi:MAG: tRNA pseudouridine(55) synthase TruB [Patescibacteria group bacterium]|jgi:tRNA pseudouridine55 synthase
MKKESGFIFFDKPAEITSHGVIAFLRHITMIKKIGHAGTLDPFATGLLIVGVGREATKRLDEFLKKDKEYEATLHLGVSTDTYDCEGKILNDYVGDKKNLKEIKKVVADFVGEQDQIPPMFSAKKINGKKLYELARKGIEVERKPSRIKIYKIKILKYSWPNLKLRIKCSSGTYIRSLASDIGGNLGCGAHLSALRRTAISKFSVKKAVKKDKINQENWQNFLRLL